METTLSAADSADRLCHTLPWDAFRVLRSRFALFLVTGALALPGWAQTTTTTVTDPVGEVWTYTFEENLGVKNLLSKTSNTDGKGVSQVFDTNNNLQERTDEEGRVTQYGYNPTNQRDSMTEAFGTAEARTTTYEYQSPDIDLITKVTEPSVAAGLNKETVTVYNPDLTVQSITINGFKDNGNAVSRSTSFQYNPSGQVREIDGPRTDVADLTTIAYYECTTGAECGQIQSVTNALGHQTTYDLYDANGRLKQMTDPVGVVTTYDYYPRGWLKTVTQTPPAGQGPARVTQYTYDPVGQLETVTTPDGIVLTYGYDAAHDLKTITDNLGNQVSYLYDLKGNRRQEDTKDPDGTLVRTVSTVYDLRDRVESINTAGSLTQLVHDAVGNLQTETDPNLNPATTHQYDPLHRLAQTLDAMGGTTDYTYDIQDRVKKVIAPNGAKARFSYDDLGDLQWDIIQDRGSVNYQYDDAGNITRIKDARNVLTYFSYDALNRPTGIDYPGTAEDVTFGYDTCVNGTGRLCQIIDESGTTDFEYDVWGNVKKETALRQGVTYVTEYSYDAGDRILTLTYPDGRVLTYQRDAIGRIEAITSVLDGTLNILTARDYRADGLIRSQTFGNGLVETRGHDLQGRLETQTLGSLVNWSYEYDANGNVKKRNQPTEGRDYDYDPLDRLTIDIAQLATASIADYGYGYDGNGNRTSLDKNGTITPYTYENAISNRLDIVGTDDIGLDPAGNLISDQNGARTFTYNGAGRLTEVFESAVLKATFTYNANGQRTRKVAGSKTFVYLYDTAGNLIAEYKNGKPIKDYIWADGLPVAHLQVFKNASGVVKDTTSTYLLADHLGTPRIGTDPAQALVWRWDSDAFGIKQPDADPDGDGSNIWIHLRFPGQYRDSETGLYYNWNRYYDPNTGRYITSDPIGLRGGLNTYIYADSNPLFFLDIRGLDSTERSPNPRKPKISVPKTTDLLCIPVGVITSRRNEEIRACNENFNRNLEVVQQGCSLGFDNCEFALDIARCVENAVLRCRSKVSKLEQQNEKALAEIRQRYKFAGPAEELCELVP